MRAELEKEGMTMIKLYKGGAFLLNGKELVEYDVNMQMTLYGNGTANSEMLGLLGLVETEKAVIMSIVREDKIKDIKMVLTEKFDKVKDG